MFFSMSIMQIIFERQRTPLREAFNACRLRKKVIHMSPDITDKWVLHYDNVPCHTALSIIEFFTLKGIPVVPQLPYSPDHIPCGFFLFPILKNFLKRCNFGTLENIQKSCNGLAEDHAGRRLPALLPKVGTTLPSLCSCPRELF